MYLQYFGLRENPFSLPPDPHYLYLSRGHQEALAHLQYGLSESGGFVQLTGEVGTGKTLLIRAIVERLPEDVDVALVLYPVLSVSEFVAAICDELRVAHPDEKASLKHLIDALNAHLLQTHARGRNTVLIIDEAQNLNREVLEQIRLLTNLETTKQKLLRIILIGQPELSSLLAQQDLRQLAQRITARYHLVALTRRETYDYIVHRCRVAGAKAILFDRKAMENVFAASGGIPRLINVICDRSLLGAYAREKTVVDAAIMRRAVAEVGVGGRTKAPFNYRVLTSFIAGALLLLVAVWQFPRLHEYFHLGEKPAIAAAPSEDAVVKPAPTASETPSTAIKPDAEPGTVAAALSGDSSAPVTPQRNNPVSLETMLANPQVTTDTDTAMKNLFDRWGLDYAAFTGATVCERALKAGLHCVYQTGTWNNLRSYNRPAIIELQDAAGHKHHVLVASLTADSVWLEMGGERKEFPLSEAGRYWFGKYLLLWRPTKPEQETLRLGDRGEAVVWLRDALARYRGEPLAIDASDLFNDDLETQLRQFQRRQRLTVDGVAGRITLAQLQGYFPPGRSPTLRPDTAVVEAR
jgi:general secretion pathway protein A